MQTHQAVVVIVTVTVTVVVAVVVVVIVTVTAAVAVIVEVVELAVPSFAELLLVVVGPVGPAEPVSSCRLISAGASAGPWRGTST